MLTMAFSTNRRNPYPKLVYSEPLAKALQDMQADIAMLKALAPETPTIPALERQANKIAKAFEQASRPGEVLTVEEVAYKERVTPQAIRERLANGIYKGAQKRGGEWRVPASAVDGP